MGLFDATVRSEAEIEAEIADEIEFHLEQRTRELVAAGMGEAEARTEAERRFGSLERVRQGCRWIQLGERIMLQRIQVVLNLVLVTAVVVLGWSFWSSNKSMQEELHRMSALLTPHAAELAPREAAPLDPQLERFKSLADREAAAAFASELSTLPPANGCSYMQEGWSSVKDPQLRIALLEPFATHGGHAQVIEILHLAATDSDREVRERAFEYLRSYAWQDFSGKPASIYHEWHAEVGGMALGEALSLSAERYAERLRAASGPALVRELGLIESIDLAPAQLRGRDVLHDVWWSGGEENVGSRIRGWLTSDNAEVQLAALRFVAHFPQQVEAISDELFNVLLAWPWKSTAPVLAACRALATCPQLSMETYSWVSLHLLRLCVESDTPEVRRDVGAGLLARLWRLPAEPERGAAQWSAWWKENRARFSEPKMLESEDARWLDAR